MMNIARTLTQTIGIFAEKTPPGSHRVALLLSVVMVDGGSMLQVTTLLRMRSPG